MDRAETQLMSDPQTNYQTASTQTRNESTNDLLRELIDIVRGMQHMLSEKTPQKGSQPDSLIVETMIPEQTRAKLTFNIANEEVYDVDLGPVQGEKIRSKQESYRSECGKMQQELDFLIAHCRIVGQTTAIIEASDELKNELLNDVPFQSLESAVSTLNRPRMREALQDVESYLSSVSTAVAKLHVCLHELKGTSHLRNVKKWQMFCSEGQEKMNGFLGTRDLEACLKYLYSDFIDKLIETMRDAADEISTLERDSVNSWLLSEKTGEFEQWYKKYTNHVSSFQVPNVTATAWAYQEVETFKQACTKHRVVCKKMDEQLRRLIGHYEHIGGDKEVIRASQFLRERLQAPMETFEWYLSRSSHNSLLVRESMTEAVNCLGWLHFAASDFQNSLYHQKHAFYFHNVEQWVAHLWNGWRRMIILMHENRLSECRECMQDMLSALEETMFHIVEDLETFRQTLLPSFLAEEKERDTTQYANITTIATFFSSVTATTLQISYSLPSSKLLEVTNLFWFISLVFSISSGVSSLLGLMWRKSSIYHTNLPPTPIRWWLEKAPIVFLIIAALVFTVGLNLLTFLSSEHQFEAITTVAFTAVHVLGLLFVMTWFVLELKQNNNLAKWILHPLQQYHRDLQLQREIYWALGIDSEVGRLTYEMSPWIEQTRQKPRSLSAFVRYLLKIISFQACALRTKHQMSGDPEEQHGTDPSPSLTEVKREFREALVDKFGNTDLVEEVMKTIKISENPHVQNSEKWFTRLRLLLWGYPELVKKLNDLDGLLDRREQAVESGVDNSPEYFFEGRKGRPDSDTLPLEAYYRPEPATSDLINRQRFGRKADLQHTSNNSR